ncbi:MAG: hypothetical protein JWR26_2148 [Pedosphaera sp.]|nr:hypothetical protein [Pedosphaera sp.]
MDSLLTIVIIIVVASIFAWFKKLGQTEREKDSPMDRSATPPANQSNQPRPVARPQAQPRPTSWEEELRRLLEGDAPAPAPPPLPRQPPVVIARPVPTVPAQPIRREPLVVTRPVLVPPPVRVEVTPRGLAPMDESRRAYDRGSQLDQKMSDYIQKVPGQHVQPTSVIHSKASLEVTQVVSLFKSARTARQALIASVILGPPKSLEQPSTLFE